MAQLNEYRDAMRRLIARAWADPDFRKALATDPKACLEGAGIPCDDRRWEIVEGDAQRESNEQVAYFHLPSSPFDVGEPSDEQLLQIETLAACSAHATQCPTNLHTCCCDITVAPRLFG